MAWTREEAEAILMACREADPALFGPVFVRRNDDGRWMLSAYGRDELAASLASTVAKAIKVLRLREVAAVHAIRDDQVIARVRA